MFNALLFDIAKLGPSVSTILNVLKMAFIINCILNWFIVITFHCRHCLKLHGLQCFLIPLSYKNITIFIRNIA